MSKSIGTASPPLCLLVEPFLLGLLLAIPLWAGPPQSQRAVVSDEHHGERVEDPFRWLENASDRRVLAWIHGQNKHAATVLGSLREREAIQRQVTTILGAESTGYSGLAVAGGRVFAMKLAPPKSKAFLIVADGLDAAARARTLVDPNLLDKEGKISIDWYHPSPDGRLVAVSLSRAGTERGDLYLYDAQDGHALDDRIDYVNSGTAGGSLAWDPQGEGFYYTRHLAVPDRPGHVFQQVYYHRLGTPISADRYEMGEGLPQISEIQLAVDLLTGRVLATVQKGDGGEFAHFLRQTDGRWRPFSQFGDGIVQAVFGGNDTLLVVSRQDAPLGKLLRIDAGDPDVSRAELVVPQSSDAIVSGSAAFWGERTVVPTDRRIYVVYQLGGPSVIRVFDRQGRSLPPMPQLEVGSVNNLVPLGGDNLLFANESYIKPLAYYVFQAVTHKTEPTSFANSGSVALEDIQVHREMARSQDGTLIPVNIMMRQGTVRDGSNPCIVTGYGGYAISLTPSFRPLNRVFFDRGAIMVVANLRGGGEFGEAWHRAGNLTRKQNVFDDFAACLRHMIDRDYTRPNRLGIVGGSNGGLLMGATMTQNPELLSAVVAHVGIYDMVRSELSPNGAFNVPEFGTVRQLEQFRALYAYSPYHRVVNGVCYPPTLLTTGANDPRVDPMQSRKMAARLQEATDGEVPILLRTRFDAGHGGGQSLAERVEQATDTIAFLLHFTRDRPVRAQCCR